MSFEVKNIKEEAPLMGLKEVFMVKGENSDKRNIVKVRDILKQDLK